MQEKLNQLNHTVAWHYTTGQKFVLIQKSGLLKRTAIGISYPELPILWFSTHTLFEPSAQKGLAGGGAYRRATIEEMRQYGMGVYRYGIATSALIPWPELASKSRMSRSAAKRLEARAIEWGATPLQWLGTLEDIPVQHLSIERMNDNMQWENV